MVDIYDGDSSVPNSYTLTKDVYTGRVPGALAYQPGNTLDGLCDLKKVSSAGL